MDRKRQITFSIQEEPEMLEELRAIAERDQTSIASLYRRAVRLHLPFLRLVPTKDTFPKDAAMQEIAA